MDQIRIVDLEVFANHGVYPEENALGQKFLVSATLHADLGRACEADCLECSVNYGEVCHLIDRAMKEEAFDLIERVAQMLADAILEAYPAVERVDIEVKKPWAPIGLPLSYASVAISRSRA